MCGGVGGCVCVGIHIRVGVGIQKTAGTPTAPSTPIWRGCSYQLLFSLTHTHTHAHHYPHHHRALNMNKAAVCLNYRFVTSLAPSLPSSLPPCEQWKFVASVTWATSICEVVIVLIWVSHAEPDSHVSRAVCVRAIILEVWVGWDYNCLPNSRTACRTLCMYLCSCMRIVIALAALPHYVLKMDVFTSFLSLCPSLS